MIIGVPRQDDSLVLQDGALPPCPIAYLGAARVRLIADRWNNRNRAAGDEFKWTLEVLSEPRLVWQTAPSAQLESNSVLKFSSGPREEAAAPGIAQIPGGGGIVLNAAAAGNFRVAGITPPTLPRNITRHDISFYVKSDSPAGTIAPEFQGALSGAVRLAPQVLTSIADVQKAEAASAQSKDGVKLAVRDCKVADDGAVALKAEVERPGGGIPGIGNAVIRQMPVGGGALPANIARAINPMFADGDSFRLFDSEGQPYSVSIGETSSSSNAGVTVYSYTLECQPAGKDAKPRKLELHGPRRATVESRFTLRNVPTP
jgi:hypothetical protein